MAAEMEAPSELRQAHRTAALIAGGLITSLVMYGVIANVVSVSRGSSDGLGLPEWQTCFARYVAWSIGALVALALPALRRVLLRRRPDETRPAAIARLTFTNVAVEGLAEFPAIAGFGLVLVDGLFLDFYLLGSLSLALLLANFPRYAAWEAWLAAPAPGP